MQHLTCFASGMLALGSTSGILQDAVLEEKHLQNAKDLCDSCYKMYTSTITGLSPDEASFLGSSILPTQSSYLLRPEVIESIFYLWRITQDPKYREWGWNIFQSLEKNTRMMNGYGGIKDVQSNDIEHLDRQDSFFLAETLKYMWLLFQDPSNLPLAGIDDEHGTKKGIFYVFNTEAHPMKVFLQ